MNVNPNISAATHRWGVALLPLVTGLFAVVIKALNDQEFNETTWWLLGSAAATNALTVYLNWIRGTSPQ